MSASYSGKAIQVNCNMEFLDNKATSNTSTVSKRTFFFVLTTYTQHCTHMTFQKLLEKSEDKSSSFRNVMYIVWCIFLKMMEKVVLFASDVLQSSLGGQEPEVEPLEVLHLVVIVVGW
jgi:hypothetical protein